MNSRTTNEKAEGWVLDEAQSLPILKYAYDSGIRTWDSADVSKDDRTANRSQQEGDPEPSLVIYMLFIPLF
jgi:hypothetical protein